MTLVLIAAGILVLLILTALKIKPVAALLMAAAVVGVALQLLQHTLSEAMLSASLSLASGFFSTLLQMAPVIMLGAWLGKAIEAGGAAQQISHTLVRTFGVQHLPWAVMITGLLVGIPLFYNAGFVLLVPLIFSLSRSYQVPLLRIALPMAAALSVTHGFLPPHPGPVALIVLLQADTGYTLGWGLLLALPIAAVAGPLLSRQVGFLVAAARGPAKPMSPSRPLPAPGISFLLAAMPVLLIVGGSYAKGFLPDALWWMTTPVFSLGISALLASWWLLLRRGDTLRTTATLVWVSQKEIVMIMCVIAAGGAFKQVLIDGQAGDSLATLARDLALPPLVFGWLVAALVRVTVGSATVAALTAGGLAGPLLAADPAVLPELMVLAIGAGSLALSHVNDTGFWMFKEYFNLSLRQTFQTWTLMETVVSLLGLAGVCLLNLILN